MSNGVVRARGLPFQVSEADFLGFFNPHAPAQVLIGGKGEGFAQFDSDDTANRVVGEKNRQYLGPRYVELFLSSEDEMNQRAPVNSLTGEAYCHIRGLPFQAAAEDLVQFCSAFGTQLADVSVKVVMTGPNQGKPSGDAVIKFPNIGIRDKAINELNEKSIGSRYVEMFPANQNDFEMKGGLSRSGVGSNSVGGGGGGMKDGDWICPGCGDHQFARNTQCRKCGGARPDNVQTFQAQGASTIPSSGMKDGDWMCPACGDHQFARNTNCRKCAQPKPLGGGMSVGQIGGMVVAPMVAPMVQAFGQPRENVPPPAVAAGAIQVRLRGCPPTCGQVEVSQFLSDSNVAPANVTLTYTRAGQPSGDAYVSFATQWQADEVCRKNGQALRGMPLQVAAVNAQGMPIAKAVGYGAMGGKGGMAQRASPYGKGK